MKRTTEDKVVFVLSIVLVILTAVALNVRQSEASYQIEADSGVYDTGDEFNPPCGERVVLTSFQVPPGGELPCGIDLVKRVFPLIETLDDCPTPLFLAHFDVPDTDTQECAATTSVISL